MIAVNFGFLFSSTWRFLFYLLLASIAFSYNDIGGKIVGSGMVAVAFYNTYVLCRYPTYRKIREKIAEEEDKVRKKTGPWLFWLGATTRLTLKTLLSLQRIEARISKEVKRQMAGQIMKT